MPLGSFSKKARHESAGQMMKQMFLGREDREELDDTEDETDETTKGVPSDQEDSWLRAFRSNYAVIRSGFV